MEQLVADGRGSRTTVASAYRELTRRGLVRGVPGKGYVVLAQRASKIRLTHDGVSLASGGAARTTGSTAVEVERRLVLVHHASGEPMASIALKLGLDENNLVVFNQTHHGVEGAAGTASEGVFLLQEAWYPASVAQAAGIAGTGQAPISATTALEAAGLAVSARDVISFRAASDAEAETLGLPSGESVVQVERTLTNEGGSPVALLQIVAPALRTELDYRDLPVTGTGLGG
ncbi:UTRA domain-containing protein [Kitasatospora sp. RB6PN24]|nr:UTRA domain-containing protein [Kitasatospora humi]